MSKKERDVMIIPKMKSHFIAASFPKKREVNDQPSLTIPNQAMTVKELIVRFASGLPLTGQKIPIYEGSEEMPDIDKMDLIERESYYRELKQQREEVEDRVKKRKIKAEEMQREKTIQERVEKAQREKELKEFEEFKKSKSNSNG